MPNHTETNEYTKEQLHEAFTIEHSARNECEDRFNQCMRYAKGLEWERNLFRDLWLRYHVQENVQVAGEMDYALDFYFNNPDRMLFMTPKGGYYAIVPEEDCLFIVFAWSEPDDRKEMLELIKSVQDAYGQPIRYTGVFNVAKNHSIEVRDGLWELRL